MKKPVKKMRRDRIYYRLAGGDNIIICTVDHKTHKVTKKKESTCSTKTEAIISTAYCGDIG